MKKTFGIIYKVTNKTNGKVYIGQTMQSFARRKGEHVYRFTHKKRDHLIYKAFEKYGLTNFTWEIIRECKDLEEMNQVEIKEIEKHNSYKKGYNMTPGGDGLTAKARKKISVALKGRKMPWHHKIIEARRRNGTLFGYPQAKGPESPNANTYIVTEPNGVAHIVKGLRAWCRDWKKEALNHPGLIEVARGRRTNHKGYICRYANQKRSETILKGSTPKRVEMGNILSTG